ncbi:hypothetical protein B0T14DRAFT_522131 [Immersiella caudata]|uniref:Uncharacterized protein n=1 Tax=Immersiella caudata TaxID=314043 RepID=A0AA39WSH7_9PEZI|nr:hypothetical protein B0T14DRAFT_522131 [Immersiella caudata]
MASSSKSSHTQRRLIKDHGIRFDNPIEDSFHPPASWPDTRKTLVKHVQSLGVRRFQDYKESVSCDALHRPWRGQARRRANRTANLSQRCLEDRKNESGWRFSVETEIMKRMSIEVACPTCRGRLWRSEQEVEPGDTAAETVKRLRLRQENRRPCTCDPDERQDEASDLGINLLFDCMIDEAIVYPPELQAKLPRREERPDRVYGLRATKRLDRILSRVDKRHGASGQCIGDSVRSHPFREDAEPVHFPFLLLEAKSEKGPDSLSDAANQSAFSIRELLLIQQDLQLAAEESPDWDAGPLVWFLSYKGEEWKVSIAYIDKRVDCSRFRIAQVWRGAVNTRDNALRLLLIVDYIFDWARDLYREAVIRSLRRLAISDSRSLAYHDSDIFSTAERVRIWDVVDENADERNEELAETEQEPVISDALRAFDTRQGVIRDIRYIHSRFFGIHVTKDNLDALLNSTDSQKESRDLATCLLSHLQEGWRVKGEVLDGIESDWTGTNRRENQSHQEATFLVIASVAAYLTPDWEQTRELSYLAVEVGALDRLLKHSGWKPAEGHSLDDFPFVDMAGFNDSLLACRRQSAKDNLLACISRVCLSTGILSSRGEEPRDALSVISVEKSREGVIVRTDTVLKPDMIKRDTVRALYDRHKIGRNEPFCSFIRASSVRDELGLPEESSAPHEAETEVCRWFKRAPDIPRMSGDRVLIATAINPVTGSATPRLCLFVTDPAGVSMSGLQFQELLQSEPRWYFRARRYDNRRGWSNGWNVEPESTVTRERPIMHQLAAFADALKTLDARSSQKQNGAGLGSEFEHPWAPSKPNTMWDMLLAPGLEFMSDATSARTLYPPVGPLTTASNPRRIRQVNREDTPRPTTESRSKGKEPETTRQAGPIAGQMSAEGSRPKNSTSTTQIATAQTPVWGALTSRNSPSTSARPSKLPNHEGAGQGLQNATTSASNQAHSPVPVHHKSSEQQPSERSPKRQRTNHEQPLSTSEPTTPQPGPSFRPSTQSLSIPSGAEHKDMYIDDDTLAMLLADGYFSGH